MIDRLLTRLTTKEENKQLFIENVINNTDNVSKITNGSVINGIAYGVAAIAQKSNKDIAIVEASLFPEFASGFALDTAILRNVGITRLQSSGSSTFVRVKADPTTQYIAGVHTFISKTGTQFEITESVTIDINGFGYIPVRSINQGESTNSVAQSIVSITPSPVGHISCLNDFAAVGGRDLESDQSFKLRALAFPNYVSKSTLLQLLEVIRRYDSNILRIFKTGIKDGKIIIKVVRENGSLLTNTELNDLLININDGLALCDSQNRSDGIGVIFQNIDWEYIDIDFRIQVDTGAIISDVRQSIQLAMSQYLDFRYWDYSRNVEWDSLLQIAKDSLNVSYIPDEYFTPNSDIKVLTGKLPRVRSFIMRDLDGNILFDNGVLLTPVFYSNNL